MLVKFPNGVYVNPDEVTRVQPCIHLRVDVQLKGGVSYVFPPPDGAHYATADDFAAGVARLLCQSVSADADGSVAITDVPKLCTSEYLRLQCLQLAVSHANVLASTGSAARASSGTPNVQSLFQDFVAMMGLEAGVAKPKTVKRAVWGSVDDVSEGFPP